MDRDKFGRFLKGCNLGEKHWGWKGSKAGYDAVHSWINRNFKKDKCCECGSVENLDFANISGKYHRNISDWKVMCKKCHHIFDNVYEKMLATRKKNGSRFAKFGGEHFNCKSCGIKCGEGKKGYPKYNLCKNCYMVVYQKKSRARINEYRKKYYQKNRAYILEKEKKRYEAKRLSRFA